MIAATLLSVSTISLAMISPGLAAARALAAESASPPAECAEAVGRYPFAKDWAEKLKGKNAVVSTGKVGESVLYAMGATLAGKNAIEAWWKDESRLEVNWQGEPGKLEIHPLPDLGARGLPASAKDLKAGWAALWGTLTIPLENELLSSCSKEICKVKFNVPETESVAAGVASERGQRYWQALKTRIEKYRSKGEIFSYEKTSAAIELKSIKVPSEFPTDARATAHDGAAFAGPTKGAPLELGYDYLDAAPGNHKPVTGVFARSCRPGAGALQGATVCQDVVLYNNHYFDFWGRQFVFLPWCGSKLVLVYEAADVDQFKETRMAMVLVGQKLKKLLEAVLETRLQRIHVLGF